LTGRIPLWGAAMPEVWKKPILGHGYLASTFVAIQVPEIDWSASHMHNGFLEVLYNNGLVGFFLMVMIHLVVVYNLVRLIRRAPPADFRYQLAVGCLALYVNLLVGGFFNASFGGRAWSFFMMLLALVMVSEKLLILEVSPGLCETRNRGL